MGANDNSATDPTAGLQLLGQLIGQGANWYGQNVINPAMKDASGLAQQAGQDFMAPINAIGNVASAVGTGYQQAQNQPAQNSVNNALTGTQSSQLKASQQMALNSIMKAHQKKLDDAAASLPLSVSGRIVDAAQKNNSTPSSSTTTNANATPNSNNAPAAQYNTQPQINNAISSFLNTDTSPTQATPVDNPAGPVNSKQGNFEVDKAPTGISSVGIGLGVSPRNYTDANGTLHHVPGTGVLGSPKFEQQSLENATLLQKLKGGEPVQPSDLMRIGASKAAMAFDINQNSNEAAKSYRSEYQKMADDSGWSDTVKSAQLATSIPSNTNNPYKQQQLVEAATGEKLGDLLKDPDAMKGLKSNLGNQAEGMIKKLSQGNAALTSQQINRLKDVVNQQYQTKKAQFMLASKGMGDQIQSDNKRRVNGAQVDPKDVLRPMDVVNNQDTKPSAQSNVPKGRIAVKDKNGQIGHIPENQLNDALSSGYSRI